MKASEPGAPGGIARALLRRAAGASAINLGMQLFSTALGLVIGIVMSRMFGASGMGIYAFAIALTTVMNLAAQLGMGSLLVREVAVAEREERWGTIKGLVLFSESASILTSILIGGLVWFVVWQTQDADTARTVAWSIPLIIGLANTALRNAALRGLDAVIAAQIPLLGIRPVSFLLFLGVAWVLTRGEAEPWHAMQAHAAAYGVAMIASIALWRRYRPAPVARATPDFAIRRWLRAALPLLALGGLGIINSQADILMLKWMNTSAETGIYSIANKLAAFSTLVLSGVNAVVASRFAALHAGGQTEDLQYLVTGSAAGITLATVPIAGALVLFGPWVLALYGPEFSAGYGPMILLIAGQLVNAWAGSVGLLLIMTGNERVVGWVSTGTAVLNILLNALLIPRFGAMGAAFTTSLTMVVWNVILVFRVRAVLGIQSTAIGFAIGALRAKARARR